MKVKHASPLGSLQITADAEGLVSRAGTALTGELADRVGLTSELSRALEHIHNRRPAHDPGRVIADLASMLVDGGECIADLQALAEQPQLFGSVASHSTASRVLHSLGDAERAGLRTARAAARKRAWELGARPDQITLDFDSRLVDVHSEKEHAAPTRKGGFGFHPLACWLDETQEALAGLLRAGNAGANDANDHIAVLDRALAQLPASAKEKSWSMLARADTAGGTHDFAGALRERKIRFSLGYPVQQRIGEAAIALPKRHWKAALDLGDTPRKGAWVAELTDKVDLQDWPEGTRLICRKERPHPGAQLRFTDVDGHRYTCFITDQRGRDLAELELRHRAHARVEDRVQESSDLGLERFPFQSFESNQSWFELALLAQDLLAWLRLLVLDGELAKAKPKRLRHRLLHVAGRITRSARRRVLHLPRSWPWAQELLQAFVRLRALAVPG